VLAESHDTAVIVEAVTDYVARRMVEREHAMVVPPEPQAPATEPPRRSRLWPFVFGFVLGAAALFGVAVLAALRSW
ncbi:MAG: hypothetical protein HOQ20_22500, partial [Bradyrhizobium sp.]|nr:hypothetical protein [Bradyrhizobium sp.]